MEQPQLAGLSDAQLEALRDDLALSQSKIHRRVSYLGLAFGFASLIALRFVPIEIFILGPPVFMVVALMLLAPSFGLGARRADVVSELENRGVRVVTAVSPLTGQSDPRAVLPAANELGRSALQRLRLPGIGAAVSMVVLLSFVAAIVITDSPDGSWLFTATFILFVPLGVFLVWTVLVLVSVGQIRR